MKNPVSPKVGWPVFAGFILTALLGSFNLITPDMVAFLGPWTPWVLGTSFTLLQYLVGYYKTDPLRATTGTPATVDTPAPDTTPATTSQPAAAFPPIQFPTGGPAVTKPEAAQAPTVTLP